MIEKSTHVCRELANTITLPRMCSLEDYLNPTHVCRELASGIHGSKPREEAVHEQQCAVSSCVGCLCVLVSCVSARERPREYTVDLIVTQVYCFLSHFFEDYNAGP
jgi:succinate dehydrogenase/fumarate reductase-like Fe-S protein